MLFGPGAPHELREISVVTATAELTAPICPGDVLTLGPAELEVASVGELANQHLAELGHVTFRFGHAGIVQLPGEVAVVDGAGQWATASQVVGELVPGASVRIIAGAS